MNSVQIARLKLAGNTDIDMEKQIALTEARDKFSEIVNEVMYRGDTYVISKLGKPAVAVVPLKILEQWRQQRQERFAVLKRIQNQNAESPVAQLADEEVLNVMDELVHEVRAKTQPNN